MKNKLAQLRCGIKLLTGHHSKSGKTDSTEKQRTSSRRTFGRSSKNRSRRSKVPTADGERNSQILTRDDKTADSSIESSDPFSLRNDGKIGVREDMREERDVHAKLSNAEKILKLLEDDSEDANLKVYDGLPQEMTDSLATEDTESPSVANCETSKICRGLESISENANLIGQEHQAAARVTRALRLYRTYRLAHKKREDSKNEAARVIAGALAVNHAKNVLIRLRESKYSSENEARSMIVSALLCYRDRKKFLEKKRAFVTISTAFAVYRANKILARMKGEKIEQQNHAARVIAGALGAYFARNKARQEFEQKKHAAMVITRAFVRNRRKRIESQRADATARERPGTEATEPVLYGSLANMPRICGLSGSYRLSTLVNPINNCLNPSIQTLSDDPLDEKVRKISWEGKVQELQNLEMSSQMSELNMKGRGFVFLASIPDGSASKPEAIKAHKQTNSSKEDAECAQPSRRMSVWPKSLGTRDFLWVAAAGTAVPLATIATVGMTSCKQLLLVPSVAITASASALCGIYLRFSRRTEST